MDRLIYTAMTGASQALEQQAVVANNLANVSTTGFRAQLANFRAVPMSFGDGSTVNDQTTRTYVLSATPGSDMTPGAISHTGNPLDIAIQGQGFMAVQTADGNEAYTRAGNLHVDENGQLVTANNLQVIGADQTVQVATESLEGSNVNPVAAMVSMITNARQFQMQTKLLQNADQNEQSANQLLNFS